MKISGICFTRRGSQLAERINRELLKEETAEQILTDWYFKGQTLAEELLSETSVFTRVREPMTRWAEQRFQDSDAIIFVGATGIAVRAIAPHVRDKRTDPAVIVLDEQGKFCISLLSGHIGGANDLVRKISEPLGCIPVITTATDVNSLFAVDEYAKKNHMVISNMTYAKEVSAALLSGYPVGFYTHFPVKGELPEGLTWSEKLEEARRDSAENENGGTSLGIYISPSYNRAYFDHTLWLIPRCLVLGIGCKRGTPTTEVKKLAEKVLREHSLYLEAVSSVASIDLKADEPALINFAGELGVPFHTFSAEQLKSLKGSFTSSEFVEKVTGVDNICERSAVMDGGGRLIIRKTGENGVTCAVALLERSIEF